MRLADAAVRGRLALVAVRLALLALEFAGAVSGPLAFGWACHRGLGQFVPAALTYSLVEGLLCQSMIQGTGLAMLELKKRVLAPVRVGDTVHGEIEVDASVDPAPTVAQVEETMRVDGGKLGANAVVVVVDRLQNVGAYVSGPWWGRSVQSIQGRKVIGVAIRYK